MYWKCLEPKPTRTFDAMIASKLKEERRRLAGSLAVIGIYLLSNHTSFDEETVLMFTVSGDTGFRAIIRAGVIEGMDSKNITFMETEFQPRGMVQNRIPQQDPNIITGTSHHKKPTELERRRLAHISDGSSYSITSDLSLHSIHV